MTIAIVPPPFECFSEPSPTSFVGEGMKQRTGKEQGARVGEKESDIEAAPGNVGEREVTR